MSNSPNILGISWVIIASIISNTAITGVIIWILSQKERQTIETRLVLNLLFSNWLQSIGFIMSFKWILQDGITEDTYCSIQGVIINLSGIASGAQIRQNVKVKRLPKAHIPIIEALPSSQLRIFPPPLSPPNRSPSGHLQIIIPKINTESTPLWPPSFSSPSGETFSFPMVANPEDVDEEDVDNSIESPIDSD
ncbi:hypothetical protein G9A89_006211 [Geosiphon pyriformis]|nr:hypothetical protein G9A89_006211 [Geosiphon pyriformis]